MTVADYPDYAEPQAHATAIAVTGVPALLVAFIGQQTGIAAAGGAWGPFTFTYTVGGGYELVLTTTLLIDGFLTDVFVQHLDSNGALVWQENFTVGNHLNGAVAGTIKGVVIRGNLHGPTLKVSGTAATQAQMNAMLAYPAGNNTINSFALAAYAIPFLQESQPRVAPLAQIPGFLGRDSSAAFAGVVGNTLNFGPLLSYCGPAVLNQAVGINQGGGFQFCAIVNQRNVLNGAAVVNQILGGSVNGTNMETLSDFVLDGNLHTFGAINQSNVAQTPFCEVMSRANM